jgi:Fur family ferric uptake transcriptional regulator
VTAPHKKPVKPEPLPVPAEIQSRLERAGLRRTLATRAVLGLFLAQPLASWSHTQALASLTARGLDINRVTLYRLLDRLAACGVLQRHADDGARIWRYGLADTGDRMVPRFECGACHRQFRLTEAGAPTRAVVDTLFRTLAGLGHQGLRVDVAVHGTCASCLPDAALPREPSP